MKRMTVMVATVMMTAAAWQDGARKQVMGKSGWVCCRAWAGPARPSMRAGWQSFQEAQQMLPIASSRP